MRQNDTVITLQIKRIMSKKLTHLVLTLAISFPLLAYAGGEALFGLTFGMSAAQVKTVVPSLKMEKNHSSYISYSAKKMPKNLLDAEMYVLDFSEDKLLAITSFSHSVTNDTHGTLGKKRFSDLRSSLIQKYGKPKNEMQMARMKVYKEVDEFYECLAYDGCGLWISSFQTEGKAIVIQLKGLGRGSGWIETSVESFPEWRDVIHKSNENNNINDKKAL